MKVLRENQIRFRDLNDQKWSDTGSWKRDTEHRNHNWN